MKRAEFYSLGLVLGYGYGPDSLRQAPTPEVYTPIVAAGNRLPHSRNAMGDSLFDLLGPEFTLLGVRDDTWRASAERLGVPLVTVDPTVNGFPAVAENRLVLVRPDQHIAWVGSPQVDPDLVFEEAVHGFTNGHLDPSPSI